MQRFYWMVEGGIAGCSRPGGQAGDAHALEEDLHWLRRQGVRAVLSLTETQLEPEALMRHELPVLHLPVPDMTAPFPAQLMRALDFIDEQRLLGRPVAVHCLMGQGRTATVLAAYLVRSGLSADEAIQELRALCPGAIPSPEQETALHAFAARQDWLL